MTAAQATHATDAELDAATVVFFAADPPRGERRMSDNDRRSIERWFGRERRHAPD